MVEREGDSIQFQMLGCGDGGGEPLPEIGEHVLPAEAAASNVIQLPLEVRREIVLDIAQEEIGQESGDQPASVRRHEAALFPASRRSGPG